MKCHHLMFLLLSSLASGQQEEKISSTYPSFEEFEVLYEKHYADSAERRYRRSVYESNVHKIAAHNAQKSSKYRLGVNAFADLTQPEFRVKHLGTVTARPGALLGATQKYYLGRHAFSGSASLPEAVDWTNSTTPVKNQGHCGSCYAFSATGAMEARELLHRKAQHRKDASDEEKILDVAEQQIVDCSEYTGNQGCNGGLMDFVFDYVKTHGICAEEDYVYHADEGQCKQDQCKPVIQPNALSGYVDVAPKDAQALMEALSEGPVAVAIEADDQAFQFYHSGVLTASCGDNLNHGVLAVGYGTTENGEQFWKVKNSWGTSWGDRGYILLDRGEEGSGKCGILLAASYPVFQGQTLHLAPGSPRPASASQEAASVASADEPYGPTPCPEPERPVALQEAPGYSFCAPPCGAGNACPAVPGATGAHAMCALQDPISNDHYCAPVCKAGNGSGGCQSGAECIAVQGTIGVCMYKDRRMKYSPSSGAFWGYSTRPAIQTEFVWEEEDEVFVLEMIQ